MLVSAPLKLLLIARLKRAWAWACVVLLMLLSPYGGAARAAGEPPTTFGVTIGTALMCADQIDPYYFWTYLNQYFGPPYKSEGGAHWFKVQGTLWGAAITEVLVSDGFSQQVFLAATFKDNPDKLSASIVDATGMRYLKQTSAPFSPLVSSLGSKIIYFGQSSKIYCAKYNLDFIRR